MDEDVPDCLITGYEVLIPTLLLPDLGVRCPTGRGTNSDARVVQEAAARMAAVTKTKPASVIFSKSAIFQFRKMSNNRKVVYPGEPKNPVAPMSRLSLPTEEEIITRFRRGEITFPPLSIGWEKSKAEGIDGVVRMSWQKKAFKFAAECKRQSNPKTVEAAAEQARKQAQAAKLLPLVVVSYLDEEAIAALESRSVSGIDLCGNGVVVVPGEWYVRRTGNPNPFRAEGVIKNVYRKSSSVVARLFLTRPEFDSVQDALDELGRRGGRVTLSTVSKVCKRLEDDVIIERKREGMTRLRLIQPEKLLDRLAANYEPGGVKRRLAGKLCGIERTEFRMQLRTWAEKTGGQVSLTGACSVGAYAVMACDGAEEYYCSDVADVLRALGGRFQPAERFATVCLLETRNEEVYFDRRDDLTASPVQTLLELTGGDKRDQETVDQVRKVIMSGLSPLAAR